MSKDTGVTVSMKLSAKAAGALYMRNMSNEKLITKQSEQINMLRECLELSIPFLPFNAVVETKAIQVLEATKPVDEQAQNNLIFTRLQVN